MTLQEILDHLNKAFEENGELTVEKFQEIINQLSDIVKKQNDILFEIRNSNIRLENKIKYIENELERSKVYKNIVEVMMEKIKQNPVSALIYLYRVRANIEKMSRGEEQ